MRRAKNGEQICLAEQKSESKFVVRRANFDLEGRANFIFGEQIFSTKRFATKNAKRGSTIVHFWVAPGNGRAKKDMRRANLDHPPNMRRANLDHPQNIGRANFFDGNQICSPRINSLSQIRSPFKFALHLNSLSVQIRSPKFALPGQAGALEP